METTAEPHVYYELLPSYITPESVRSERDELVHKVEETLERLEALRNGSSDAVDALMDGTQPQALAKRHFRVIRTLFTLKHELPKALHLQLIRVLVDLLWDRDGRDFDDLHMELRALSTLTQLLTTWSKRPASERSELVLSWRAGWKALERACFESTGSIRVAAQSSLQQLCTSMIKSVQKARKYFVATDASEPLLLELWRVFAPTIRATESTDCFKALALFVLFAVVPADADDWTRVEELLPEWFATWSTVSNCAEWDGHWMKLLSRAAKMHPDTHAWTPYLPFIFGKIHDALALPSDLGAPYQPNTWPSAYYVLAGTNGTDNYAMRLCVYLLRNPDADGTPARANEYVLEILHLLTAFFHPSNVANSANALGVSVYYFSNLLAHRLGREKAAHNSSSSHSSRAVTPLALATVAPLVDALLALAFFGIYSKHRAVASKCMYVIKNVVCIDPARCAAPVLDEIMKGLDPMAMSHAHLASTAIATMGTVLYHLMIGKDARGTALFFTTYLAPMLRLTLPGIDANDEKKTASTISLYFHVLSWLPLVNDTAKRSSGHTTQQRNARSSSLFDAMAHDVFAEIEVLSTDVDAKLWELGAFLEEWALALVDRCLEFIKSRVGQAEGSSHTRSSARNGSNGNGASKSHDNTNDDPIVMDVLNVMGLLYLQLSPELYAKSVRKTLAFVSDVFFTTRFGGHVASELIYACVQADPATSFAPFMTFVLDKLRATSETLDVAALMPNEKRWLMHLFDGVVRCNTGATAERPILAFARPVRVVLAHFLDTENADDKDLYETAHTALAHVLTSLTGVYPSEFRSLPPDAWTDAVAADSSMFQYLGAAMTWQHLVITWHEPTAAELAFAYELLDAHVLGSLTALAAAQTQQDCSVRTWLPRLKLVTRALDGAKNVLVTGSPDTSSLLERGSLPLLERALSVDAPTLLTQFVSFKATLVRATHAFVQFWQTNGTGSTVEIPMWQALIAIMNELLVARGDHLSTHRHRMKQHQYAKATALDIASDALRRARSRDSVDSNGARPRREQAPLASRNEMIERVLHFYTTRKVQEHYALAHASRGSSDRADFEALLLDLETLMQNAYEGIRTDASAAMREMAELYTSWYRSRISSLLSVLEGSDTVSSNGDSSSNELTDETVAGVLAFLSRSEALEFIWTHREQFYGRVVTAVLRANDALLTRVPDEAKKLKVGARVEAFFLTLLASWRYVQHARPSTALLTTLLAAEPLASAHWKLQLVHLVSLYPLLQPAEMPLPISVWRLVLQQLRNDVLPVRLVALALFAHLVQLHKHALRTNTRATDSGEAIDSVDTLLFSPETMAALVDVNVRNLTDMHRMAASADGQHANSAPANWSLGIDAILHSLAVQSSSYPRPEPISTVRLFHQSRSSFAISVATTKMVQKLVQLDAARVVRSGVVAHLLTLATDKADAKRSDEERQSVLTTLAEWVTGLLRGLLKTTTVSARDAESHIATVIDVLKAALPHVTVSHVDAWGHVLFLVARPARTSQLPLARLAPLLTFLLDELQQSFARATAEDYARQVKWLVLVEALAVHVLPASATAPAVAPLAESLSARVLAVIDAFALTHQYKIIRDRVGRLLFLLGAYAFAPRNSVRARVPVDAVALPLQKLVEAAALEHDATAATRDTSALDANDATAPTTSLYARETAMQWLLCAETHGETRDVFAVLPALAPVAFLSQNHPKAEVAVLAKNTTNALASSLRLFYAPRSVDDMVVDDTDSATVSEASLDALLALLDTLAVHRFWKTRGAVLRFVTTFAFYHWIVFSPTQRARVQTLVCAFLTDDQREVQEMAKYTLRTLLHHQRPDVVAALSRDWTTQAHDLRVLNPKTKRRITRLEAEAASAGDTVSDELIAARLKLATNEAAMVRSVLGMCAVVLAFPHTVPPFVPPMFEALGPFLYVKQHASIAVSYLAKAVKETLLEFKRTHQDNWRETKRTFSRAQLDVIEDVSISPGYYT